MSAGRAAILISGYFGFGNLGDEAILAGMVGALRDRLPGVRLVVLSADPPATRALHGVEAVARTAPLEIARAMRRARLFLSGGGSLLQDVTSTRSALYYLALLRLAQVLVPRTMVFAQGLGPLRGAAIRRLALGALQRADAVTLRDPDAVALARSLGVRRGITLTADAALLVAPAPAGQARALLEAAGVDHDVRPLVGVALRPWRGGDVVDAAAAALGGGAPADGRVVVLPFYPAQDLEPGRRLATLAQGVLVDLPRTPGLAMAAVGQLDLLVGMRMHALLFAAATGVPCVGLAYDPKIPAVLSDLGLEPSVRLDAAPQDMRQAIERVWTAREAVRGGLATRVERLRTRAREGIDIAAGLYGGV